MWWLGSPQISLNYVRSSQGHFSDLADGWSIVFFDVASQICNNVDIMNLEVLQYSSKPFCFLDKTTKGHHSMFFKNRKSNFFQIFQDLFQQWLSAHIHLKKVKIIGFKSGLAWKKYAKNMQQNIWVWPFCGPKILLTIERYVQRSYIIITSESFS